jgi:hypothetical protein
MYCRDPAADGAWLLIEASSVAISSDHDRRLTIRLELS